MKEKGKKNSLRKWMVVLMTAILLLSAGTAVFADEMPSQSGQMGQNPPEARGGAPKDGGMKEDSAPPEKPSGEIDESIPEKPEGETGEPLEKPEGEAKDAAPEKPEGEPGQEMAKVPEKKDEAPELDTEEREDMTPPENEDAEPGEGVPAKPEENDAPAMEEPKEKQDIETLELKGVNMMALKAYINSGEEVDEEVNTAYEALQKALEEEPVEGEEKDISALEEALNEAIENAGIDLDEYAESDEIPEEPVIETEETETEENQGFKPIEFIKYCWQKFLELF